MKPQEFYKKYGTWALVTGASSGIGAEFCRQLAALKFNLVLVARDQSGLERVSRELIDAYRIETKVIAVDLADRDFLKEVTIGTANLDIGLLVNNAGFALTGSFLEHSLERELALLDVNCRAPIMLMHLFGAGMVKRGKGGIINVASASAFLPMPFWANYAASKTYLLHFSESIGYELRTQGVDVLALCPGKTQSNFANAAGTMRGGMDPRIVVEQALKSLGKKSSVIPGFGNRIILLMNRILPRRALIKLGASVVASMSKNALK